MTTITKFVIAIWIATLSLQPVVAWSADAEPAITVSAQGEVVAAPDMAIIKLGVVEEAKTARAALTANSAAMKKVLAAMTSQGIADRDLQTSDLTITPKYYYPPVTNGERKPPVITGYTVSNTIAVRIRELAAVGTILDQAVSLGVNSSGGIQFTNADPSTLYTQARQRAMQQAIAKASTLTEAAGVDLGQLLTISESSHRRPQPMAKAHFAAMEVAADSVPIAGGENTYQVTVTVSWAIDQ